MENKILKLDQNIQTTKANTGINLETIKKDDVLFDDDTFIKCCAVIKTAYPNLLNIDFFSLLKQICKYNKYTNKDIFERTMDFVTLEGYPSVEKFTKKIKPSEPVKTWVDDKGRKIQTIPGDKYHVYCDGVIKDFVG